MDSKLTLKYVGFSSWPSYTVVESGSDVTISCVLQSNSYTTYIRALFDSTDETGMQVTNYGRYIIP